MIRRKGIPDGGCSMCCRLKQKLDELWQRTSGCILRIRGITPDGQGDFALEAGNNINITEVSNGVRIDTTGGVSYYEPADGYVTIDNDTLEIGVVAGVQDGLATQNDLETVASAVTNIIDGTTQVADAAHADSADSATNAQYLGSSSTNVGNDTKPIKIVNGVATAITDPVAIAGNTSIFKWAIRSGYATIRVQTGQQHNVTVNCPNADGNSLFPILQNSYNGPDWSNMAFNIMTRDTNGFKIGSWVNTANTIDTYVNVFWIALVPQSL